MIVRSLFTLLLVVGALLGACRKTEITSYRIPKEKDPEMPGMATSANSAGSGELPPNHPPIAPSDMANTSVPTAQGTALTWTAPAHWKAKASSPMRKGSYVVAGEGGGEADMSITAFPNDVGGELANINRWRGQIQLPPIGENDLAAAVTRHDHNGLKFGEVDLVGGGAKPQRILGAWVAFGGATWFFKLMGPDTVVAKEKAAFAVFIESVRPATTAGAPAP